MNRLQLCWFFLMVLCLGCSRDTIIINPGDCSEDVTYVSDAREIIDLTCSYSGCHDGSGAAPGSFRTYNGINAFLTPDKFERRAIEIRDMPPSNALGPTSLTQEQIEILACWIENDYKEN